MVSEIEHIVQFLFAQRLESYREAIATEEPSSTLNRTTRLAECSDLLRAHCSRALRDYIGLLELFDALTDEDGLLPTFESHIDAAATELMTALDANAQSDRNRIKNLAASLRSQAATELAEEVDRARKARERAGTEVDELDDRLPLGRRGAFDRELARAVQEAERDHTPFALVMIDIDHFKRVNDEHGHPVGDEVLLEVAKLVVSRAAGKGTAYRFGGEEFSLLLPTYSSEEAVGLAERIRKDLEAATVSSQRLNVTASFGAASVPAHASKATELLEQADAALYHAKRNGRNQVATPA